MNRYRVNSSLKRTAKYLRFLYHVQSHYYNIGVTPYGYDEYTLLRLISSNGEEYFDKKKLEKRIEFCKKHMRKLLDRRNSQN